MMALMVTNNFHGIGAQETEVHKHGQQMFRNFQCMIDSHPIKCPTDPARRKKLHSSWFEIMTWEEFVDLPSSFIQFFQKVNCGEIIELNYDADSDLDQKPPTQGKSTSRANVFCSYPAHNHFQAFHSCFICLFISCYEKHSEVNTTRTFNLERFPLNEKDYRSKK